MACCVKVCVCLVQGGEISAKKVWRFDGNEIDSYCVEGVERELLELFPKVKSSGLRLDLTYEDEFVGDVNIESDADLKTALTTFVEEGELKYRTIYVSDCAKPAAAVCEVSQNQNLPPKKKRKVSTVVIYSFHAILCVAAWLLCTTFFLNYSETIVCCAAVQITQSLCVNFHQ